MQRGSIAALRALRGAR